MLVVQAQIHTPVHFKSELKTLKGGEGEIVFSATIDPGWHVYSTGLGNNGPTSATFNAVKMEGVETVGKLQARGKELKQYDKLFEMDLRYFEGSVTFVQKVRFIRPDYDIDCYLEYGACNDQSCLPPSEVPLKTKGKAPEGRDGRMPPPPGGMDGDFPGPPPGGMNGQMPPRPDDAQMPDHPGEKPSEPVMPEQPIAAPADSLTVDRAQTSESETQQLWQPVVRELQAYHGEEGSTEGMSWWLIFLEGLLGGFIALLTPCVWPIIPMTVSFFLKRNKERAKAIREAITYGLYNAQERGVLFIGPGEKVYAGMVIGQSGKSEDIELNVCKTKHLTNTRASGSDEALKLTPPRKLSLEQAMEFIDTDELLEITPESFRIRKKILDPTLRKRDMISKKQKKN